MANDLSGRNLAVLWNNQEFLQSKSVGELVNQFGELNIMTDINVSEFEKMENCLEGLILP